MANKRPDIYEHNNPDLAFVDGDFVRGARRTVAARAALYALASKADQLKENVTIVRILSDGENGGGLTEVLLVDDANIGSAAGWQLYSTGGAGSGGGGSSVSYGEYTFTLEVDGPQTLQLPAGAQALDGQPTWRQSDTGAEPTLGNYAFINGGIAIYAASPVKAGDIIYGRYTYGGAGGSGGDSGTGDIDASRIKGELSPDNLPELALDALSQQIDDYKASLGPFTLRSAPLVASPQNGAIEFDGTTIYVTTGGVRKAL